MLENKNYSYGFLPEMVSNHDLSDHHIIKIGTNGFQSPLSSLDGVA